MYKLIENTLKKHVVIRNFERKIEFRSHRPRSHAVQCFPSQRSTRRQHHVMGGAFRIWHATNRLPFSVGVAWALGQVTVPCYSQSVVASKPNCQPWCRSRRWRGRTKRCERWINRKQGEFHVAISFPPQNVAIGKQAPNRSSRLTHTSYQSPVRHPDISIYWIILRVTNIFEMIIGEFLNFYQNIAVIFILKSNILKE